MGFSSVKLRTSVSVVDCVAVVVSYMVEVVLKTFVTCGRVIVLLLVLTMKTVVVNGFGYLVTLRVDVTVLVADVVDVHRPFQCFAQSGHLSTPRASRTSP
jgi:hypothetical protein